MHSHYKNNRTYFFICTLIILTLAIVSSVAFAAEEQIKVWSKAETKITVEKDGKKTEKKIPAVKVLPGKIVYYTTEFKNISKKSVDGINIINPIPKLTKYVSKSAYGNNTTITFSIDGGKSWSSPDKLKKKGKDGKMIVAQASDYTHIRWKHNGPLQSGKTGKATFQVTLLKP